MNKPHGLGSFGVVLLACHSVDYLAQAFLTAAGVKRFARQVPVALFTDMASNPIAQQTVFDEIYPITIADHFASQWATGKFPRISALLNSPFEKTLHLDADIRVCSSRLLDMEIILEEKELALVECDSESSFSRRSFGQRLYACGMIAFRRTAKVTELLGCWRDQTRTHHKLLEQDPLPEIPQLAHVQDQATRRRLLKMDQISMAMFLSPEHNPLGIDVYPLSPIWNMRYERPPQVLASDIILDHSPRNRKSWPKAFKSECEKLHGFDTESLLRAAKLKPKAKSSAKAKKVSSVEREVSAEAGRIREHFLMRLKQSSTDLYPCPHRVIDQVLPADIFHACVANLSELDHWESVPDEQKNIAENMDLVGIPSRRQHRWVTSEGSADSTYWSSIAAAFTSNKMYQAMRGCFPNLAITDITGASIRLVRETGACYLRPHVDRSFKPATLVLYLAPPISEEGPTGTSLYLHEQHSRSFIVAKTIPFVPNRALLMPRTPHSWHGVEAHLLNTPRCTLHIYTKDQSEEEFNRRYHTKKQTL